MAKTTTSVRPRRKITPLQTMRMARTLTQEQLATLCEVAQQTLSKYETGEVIPPADQRTRIAAILGTSSAMLWPEQGR